MSALFASSLPLFLAAVLSAAGYERASESDPLSPEFAKLAASGYSVVEKAEVPRGKERLAVVLYRKGEGQSYHLRAYKVSGRKFSLLLYEPAFGARMVLSTLHQGGVIPDLVGDGSRIVAYESTLVGAPGTDHSKLVLLQYLRGKLKRVGEVSFAHFEDVDADGRPEIVEQSRPLGKFFQLECESFFSQAQTAFRTRIYALAEAPDKAVLRDVSGKHPSFFAKRIREGEARLSGLDPRATKDYGSYLGGALSVYFDYSAMGRGRDGWARFRSFFKPQTTDPPQVRGCLKEMEGTLRRELNVPEEW